MQQTVLSERMFEILTGHVAEIEREKEFIVKGFYADNATTGMESEIFFREYTARIEEFLKNVRVKKDAPDNCPLSIIGSTVEVKDSEDMEVSSYQIVLPFTNKLSHDMSRASCLSPMGRALLLRQVGSKVAVMTPGGQVEYEIMSIKLDETIDSGDTLKLYQDNTILAI